VNESWVADPVVPTRPPTLALANRPEIAAVEVDPAGCSYNPDYEHHQDAVAEAVAAEVSKQIARDLEPAVRRREGPDGRLRGCEATQRAHVCTPFRTPQLPPRTPNPPVKEEHEGR